MTDEMIRGILLEKKRAARRRRNIGMAFTLLLYMAGAVYITYSIMIY